MPAKILIVDDEPDILMVLKKTLEVSGYAVITAVNGEDAIAAAQNEMPDLIVLDIGLPDILGTEVALKLKSLDQTAQIPVVFLSAFFSKSEETESGIHAQGHTIFAKPYDPCQLIEAINEMIENNKSCVK